MDFKDEIRQLGERVPKLKDSINTEEATKNAFIMPFLRTLGYDVFNPTEVVPEFISDIGLKKGEKIDYAIFRDGVASILIECKHWRENLNVHDGQLLRYFHVSKAKFAILTNGIIYRFYSDLVAPNKMDEKPFLEFNIVEIKDVQIEELKKFHKSYFDLESIISSASELKYTNELKQLINKEIITPSPEFVKLFAKQVYTGVLTAKVQDQFSILVKKSFQQHISDMITERLTSALTKETETTSLSEIADEIVESVESKIITTEEEIEAFLVIKSILRQAVSVSRISYRDTQSYLNILLDDTIRKTICRFVLTAKKKTLVTFDEAKKEVKFELNSIDDLYLHSDLLIKITKGFADA